MSYERVNWKNSPETPINAENLNHMDDGIQVVHDGENIPIFESNDSLSEDVALEYEDVGVLTSGETMRSIIEKISTMFKNIRYLYKKNCEKGCYSLLSDISVTTTETTYSTTVGRKITDYDLLVFQLKASANDIRASIIEASTSFTSNKSLRMVTTHGENDSSTSGAIIKYVSDTSLSIKVDNVALLTVINVYGIKL